MSSPHPTRRRTHSAPARRGRALYARRRALSIGAFQQLGFDAVHTRNPVCYYRLIDPRVL